MRRSATPLTNFRRGVMQRMQVGEGPAPATVTPLMLLLEPRV
jgi:hypothetical protein